VSVVHLHHEAWWALVLSAAVVVALIAMTFFPPIAEYRAGNRGWHWWISAVILGALNVVAWLLYPRRAAR
jgi:type VI protein secretion system component VasK